MATIQSLPGFREFYPETCAKKNHLFRVFRQVVALYGFHEYEAPILEPLELFTQKSGPEIAGQLFSFEDKGGRAVALRPEMTPSLVRMVSATASSLKKPIKWFNIGEHFRFERPQKGRLRSFYQLNCDCLGVEDVSADAEMIALCIQIFETFGLTDDDFVVRLSDRTLWMHLLAAEGVSENNMADVLSIIDKLEREPREEILKKLTPFCSSTTNAATDLLEKIGQLTELHTPEQLEQWIAHRFPTDMALQKRAQDWKNLFAKLKALGFNQFVKMHLGTVRGLAYYTGFVFEVFAKEGQSRALAGGGRYDNLVEKLGGPDMPAVGFAIGDVTLMDLLEEKRLVPEVISAPEVFVVTVGELARNLALADISTLRMKGIRTEYALREDMSLTKQMKQASQLSVRWVLVYDGEKLAETGEVELQDRLRSSSAVFPKDHVPSVMPEVLRTFGSGLDSSAGGGCCGGGGCGSGACSDEPSAGGCCSTESSGGGCGAPDCGNGACGSDDCRSKLGHEEEDDRHRHQNSQSHDDGHGHGKGECCGGGSCH
jgi:histidyl-tRNA synthetase